MAGGLYILLNHVFPDTQHYLCSSCFKLSCWGLLLQRLVDSQRRHLVRVANTNDQITLPQLGLHCRRTTNTLFQKKSLGSTQFLDSPKVTVQQKVLHQGWKNIKGRNLRDKIAYIPLYFVIVLLVSTHCTDTKIHYSSGVTSSKL